MVLKILSLLVIRHKVPNLTEMGIIIKFVGIKPKPNVLFMMTIN